jgi:hypothetical protein
VTRDLRASPSVSGAMRLLVVLACSSLVACEGSNRETPRVASPASDGATDARKPEAPAVASVAETDASFTLPPIEDTCASDADCTVIAFETSGPHVCCASCKTTPVTKAWAKRAETCNLLLKKACYPLACPMGPMKPKCESGRCIAIP